MRIVASGIVQGELALGLPQEGNVRWTARQKAAVLRALSNGSLSAIEARERYMLSLEELADWQASFSRAGTGGLLSKSRLRLRSAERPSY